jgi:hypothetical protein
MTINDFLAQYGNILQISSDLQSDLQETNTGAGFVLSFGSSAGEITLAAMSTRCRRRRSVG